MRVIILIEIVIFSVSDKSKDAISKTMVSHVSIAMGPIMPHRADELQEAFEN